MKRSAKTRRNPSDKDAESGGKHRLVSLDAFRGLTIAGMLLVNNIALDKMTPDHLEHAPWNGGVHFADMVFPWFILITGVTIPFTASSFREGKRPWAHFLLKVLGRSVLLFILGCFLTSSIAKTPIFSLGVLQLIACAYLVAALLYRTPAFLRAPLIAVLLVSHWALIKFLPVPGQGAGTFTEDMNVVKWLNQQYLQSFNLQGLVSVVPTSGLALIGTLVGDLLRNRVYSPLRKLLILLGTATAIALAGWLWSMDLPFNKSVWTASYILYTAGLGLLVLGAFHLFSEIICGGFLFFPLRVFGMNAITAYVAPILVKVMILREWQWPLPDGTQAALGDAMLKWCQTSFDDMEGGWIYTWSYILLWWIVMFILYRKKIFLRL
jgi:predicted acyltransferase